MNIKLCVFVRFHKKNNRSNTIVAAVVIFRTNFVSTEPINPAVAGSAYLYVTTWVSKRVWSAAENNSITDRKFARIEPPAD